MKYKKDCFEREIELLGLVEEGCIPVTRTSLNGDIGVIHQNGVGHVNIN